MRIKIIRVIIISLFCILALDLMYVQVIRGPYFYRLSLNNRIRVVPVEGKRGKILDVNGIPLAENRTIYNVMVTPQDIQNAEELFDYLSSVLLINKKDLLQTFYKRKITPFAPVIVAEDIDKSKAIVLEENKFRFPSLFIQESFQRYYSFGEIGAHVLGYIGKISRPEIDKLKDYGYSPQNFIGKSGVEKYYDTYLKAEQGGQQIEVNSRGYQIRLLSIKEPVSGEDIQLTIDNRVQTTASELLKDKKGAIIVMNRDNGEILAMVSTPSFDPNVFTNNKLEYKVSKFFTDSEAPLFNRAIKGLYPPGSVFKVIMSIAGLETNQIERHTSFHCIGHYTLGKRNFHCSHVHGTQNLIEGIAHSCNVYFYNVGVILGPQIIHKYAKLFELGNPTHVDLPFEETGFIPGGLLKKTINNREWYKGDTLNFSIGQGDILITPIQLVKMMTSVANDGREVQPHVIKSIGSRQVEYYVLDRYVDISARTLEIVKTGLRAAVEDYAGTAHVLDIKGLSVSGKTGTAQSSAEKQHHAWFVGFTSGGAMNVTVCIFLEHGRSSYNACLMARDLLKQMQVDKIL